MVVRLDLRFPFAVRFLMTGLLAITAACAPSAGPGSAAVQQGAASLERGSANSGAQAPQAGGEDSSNKTLTIGIVGEIKGFSLMNGNQNKYIEDLVQGNLFLQDEQGRWAPALASETPQLGTDTWKLLDDGTSEVIYRLKPGAKWHDGVDFTVQDLILAQQVSTDRDLPYALSGGARDITKVEARDDHTAKVTYSVWEPQADTADLRYFWPMPAHILQQDYQRGDKLAFINHPYWTTEFVGLGPYKLTRFEPGSYLELTAFDDYVLGKPRIGEIVVQFYQDSNVLISALLGGTVQMTLNGGTRDGALSMADGIVLATEWANTGEGKVYFNPYRIGVLAVQWNTQFQQPSSLGDVRVRQALAYAIDRPTLVNQRYGGFTDVAEGWVSPKSPGADLLADAITHYDYDPSQAQRLLAEAGWQKGPDGKLGDASGRPFELEYRSQSKDAQFTATAVADYWGRVGIETQLMVIPSQRARDHQWMAEFPGIRSHQYVALPVGGGINAYDCANVPSDKNLWIPQTQNPSGYCSPAMQDLVDAFNVAFPYNARIEPYKEMMRIALRDLPYLPLYYESEAVAVRSNVSGINAVPPKERGRTAMWAYTWSMQ